MIQSTKPQSLTYGLNDSPAGLAAWIMSFVCIGTTGEEVEKRLSRAELLTFHVIYHVHLLRVIVVELFDIRTEFTCFRRRRPGVARDEHTASQSLCYLYSWLRKSWRSWA